MGKIGTVGLLLLVLAIIGCETTIDIDIPFEGHRLTINGYLKPDSNIHVVLTETRHVLEDSAFTTVDDAKVFLFENGKLKGELLNTGSGWYLLNAHPAVGKTYTLRVESPKLGLSEAETYIPEAVKIQDVVVSRNRVFRDYEYYHVLDLQIEDPLGGPNYYELVLMAGVNEKFFLNDTLLLENSYYFHVNLLMAEENHEEQKVFGGSNSLIFSDEAFAGTGGTLKIYAASKLLDELSVVDAEFSDGDDRYRLIKNDELFLLLRHTDSTYYYFRKSLNLQARNKGNPFAEPVRVYSNVKNGFGIFAGYSTSRHSIDVEELGGF
jgi:hypothetical protein